MLRTAILTNNDMHDEPLYKFWGICMMMMMMMMSDSAFWATFPSYLVRRKREVGGLLCMGAYLGITHSFISVVTLYEFDGLCKNTCHEL